jgi:hypothetical protein
MVNLYYPFTQSDYLDSNPKNKWLTKSHLYASTWSGDGAGASLSCTRGRWCAEHLEVVLLQTLKRDLYTFGGEKLNSSLSKINITQLEPIP